MSLIIALIIGIGLASAARAVRGHGLISNHAYNNQYNDATAARDETQARQDSLSAGFVSDPARYGRSGGAGATEGPRPLFQRSRTSAAGCVRASRSPSPWSILQGTGQFRGCYPRHALPGNRAPSTDRDATSNISPQRLKPCVNRAMSMDHEGLHQALGVECGKLVDAVELLIPRKILPFLRMEESRIAWTAGGCCAASRPFTEELQGCPIAVGPGYAMDNGQGEIIPIATFIVGLESIAAYRSG